MPSALTGVWLTDGDNNAGKITPETAAEAAKTIGVTCRYPGSGAAARRASSVTVSPTRESRTLRMFAIR